MKIKRLFFDSSSSFKDIMGESRFENSAKYEYPTKDFDLSNVYENISSKEELKEIPSMKSMSKAQRLFVKFLRERDLVTEYKNEFIDYKQMEKRSIQEFLNQERPSQYIWDAIEFVNTKKGYDFWKKIHLEWLKLLRKEGYPHD